MQIREEAACAGIGITQDYRCVTGTRTLADIPYAVISDNRHGAGGDDIYVNARLSVAREK